METRCSYEEGMPFMLAQQTAVVTTVVNINVPLTLGLLAFVLIFSTRVSEIAYTL